MLRKAIIIPLARPRINQPISPVKLKAITLTQSLPLRKKTIYLLLREDEPRQRTGVSTPSSPTRELHISRHKDGKVTPRRRVFECLIVRVACLQAKTAQEFMFAKIFYISPH